MKAAVRSFCLAGLSVVLALLFAETAFAQQVMSSEPPPGQLAAGQFVYVACGPGNARKITGGSNISSVGVPQKGAGRQRGPCVPMKY
jgi:hypothetical protein